MYFIYIDIKDGIYFAIAEVMKELIFINSAYKSLTMMIYQLERQILHGKITGLKVTRQYKFYTFLVFKLFCLRQQQGVNISEALSAVKLMAQQDFNQQQEINSILGGGVIQMLLISLFLNIFFHYLTNQFGVNRNKLISPLLLAHLIGLAGLLLSYWGLYRFLFHHFELLLSYVLEINSYALSGINCFSLLQKFGEQTLLIKLSRENSSLGLLFSAVIVQIKEQGRPANSLIVQLRQELIFRYTEQVRKFKKRVEVIKFLILAIFFLGSYLYYLQDIFLNMRLFAL
jgi:hypothetical protein